ncbi:MAG: cell wall hydrolase [Lachnospiraceae bacterium]|nr:cell wall hydrolase [Lachnospiraceae bacterium]
MKKKYISTIIFSFIIIIFVILYSQVGKASGNLSDLESEKNANEQSQSMYEEQASNLQESKTALENLVSGLNSELAVINERLSDIQKQIAEKESELVQTQQELDEAKEKESEQYQDMKKRIQYMFEMGDTSYIEILLSKGSIADNLNRAEFVSELIKYDRRMLEEYKNTKQSITEKESKCLIDQAELGRLQSEVQEQQMLIAAKISDTNEQIRAYAADIAEAERAALEYEKQVERNQQAIDDESRRIEESRILEAESIERARKEQERRERESREQASREQASREQNQTRETVTDENGNIVTEETTEPYEETTSPYENNYVAGENDLDMLAALIECEAGDQTYYGMLCVGAVVMNRINSSSFPNTLYEVIYQPYQFTPVTVSNRFSLVLARGANETCYSAAREVLEGGKIVGSWLFFRMNDGSREGEIIGDHVFY